VVVAVEDWEEDVTFASNQLQLPPPQGRQARSMDGGEREKRG